MSNLIFPLAFPVSALPQPRAQACGGLAVQPCLAPGNAASAPSVPPAAPLPTLSNATPAPLPSPRCSVKGCVFPAPDAETKRCHYHELLHSEGEIFQSHQPTYLLSLHAPFGIADEEPDNTRREDRKRKAAEREKFLLDEPD